MTLEELVNWLEVSIEDLDEREATELMVEWINECEMGGRYQDVFVELNQDIFGNYTVTFNSIVMKTSKTGKDKRELAVWLSEVI